MNFNNKKVFYFAAGISSFVFAGMALIFCSLFIFFPDVILSFSNNESWIYLMTNLRLLVVVWVLVSVGLQIACGVLFMLLSTEEKFKKYKPFYITAFAVTVVFGFFVTLGILLTELILSRFFASSLPEETLK